MNYLPPIFAFIVAAAGFYYIMHASGAEQLAAFEDAKDNRLRIRLRRIGGMLMIALAVAFYVGYAIADHRGSPLVVLVCLLSVILLLPLILLLALVDLRLTRKMREAFKRRQK